VKVYRVIVEFGYSHPLLFVVDSISEIESLYKKNYPEGTKILHIELLDGKVINSEGVI